MEFTDKEYCLEVWGDMACFTRPEFKVERVSYDVITPSSARAIFEAVFWKPAIRWQVTKIEVLKPIKWTSIRRNEVGAVASVKPIYIEEKRTQTLFIEGCLLSYLGKINFYSTQKRMKRIFRRKNPKKYYEMFERRAKKGQCFNQPYLGCREFSASFRLVDTENETLTPALSDTDGGNRDLGIMLYDLDFTNPNNIQALFFRANMNEGVIIVPPFESEEILR